jgi:iron complex transport system substrate-binding protein
MTPHTLADIMENIQELGRATGRLVLAQELVGSYRERLARIHAAVSQEASRPRVFVMEWADPIYCSGHWVPEMIQLAGGVDALGRIGEDSVRLSWEAVLRWGPELLIVAPCGYDINQAVKQMPTLLELPGWLTLPAVRRGQVFCVDANAYFARPGPRIVEGVELTAHLIHPTLFGWTGSKDAYRAVP